jgi:integrase
MPPMGRRRKTNTDLEPRVYLNHGAYYYAHRVGGWERLGTDKAAANARARLYNDPQDHYGTLVYWLEQFIVDGERRVKLQSEVKGVKLAARTLQDYQDAIGTAEKPGPLRVWFAIPMTPLDVTPDMVQDFLHACAEAGRPTRGNRDKACLSAAFSWLIRTNKGKVPGLVVNPCLRASGIQRNPEKKRELYVASDAYQEVYALATASVRLMMDLAYRTLQRPQSDIIHWTTRQLLSEGQERLLHFRQHKTGKWLKIALPRELDALVRACLGDVPKIEQPLVRDRNGEAYSYDGLSAMLRRYIGKANQARKAQGRAPMPSFGFRDLKGKGATDMWRAGVPIEEIQLLCGHEDKSTTEIYVKQRWSETAQPNMVVMA